MERKKLKTSKNSISREQYQFNKVDNLLQWMKAEHKEMSDFLIPKIKHIFVISKEKLEKLKEESKNTVVFRLELLDGTNINLELEKCMKWRIALPNSMGAVVLSIESMENWNLDSFMDKCRRSNSVLNELFQFKGPKKILYFLALMFIFDGIWSPKEQEARRKNYGSKMRNGLMTFKEFRRCLKLPQIDRDKADLLGIYFSHLLVVF